MEYNILLNRKLSKDVPADIQGLQRIEYDDPKGLLGSGTLLSGIVKYLVKSHTHPKNIHAALNGNNREAKFTFAMSVLSHLRDNKHLSHGDISRLVRGTFLRKEAQDEVLQTLVDHNIISSWKATRGATLTKNLFPELLTLG